jgi:NAD(P)-dependent dehydrogenase (short-subunit alcohol dehydrogenase family)
MSTERYQPYEQPVNTEFSLPFFGKHFVIAGGTSGIGLETAKQLSKQGASVMVIGSKEESGKNAVVQIKAYSNNPNTTYEFADLSSIQSTMELAQRLRTEKPKIDGFI